MKKQISSFSILFLAGLFSISTLVGCGDSSSNAPVSGVVTLDGNPLSGIRVTFYPEPATGNSAPGPYSTAVTDSEGKFSLVDRYDNPGAMVWQHKVEFEWDELDESALSDAMEGADGDGIEDRAAVKAALAQRKKFQKIPENYEEGGAQQFVVVVPAGGLESYSLEMTSK